ncbi:unnamed protein product [Arctia plantaginis]|uniref:Uncharacterized protein n=1 Tax=Arctia plantaginis TaxID=874455 RepID=A0A8S1ATF2_ARCPL|nr:unnamed protein product [Arctia plantaginis]CAB3259897.1 unnamed protein product [Arctia plantaginis]
MAHPSTAEKSIQFEDEYSDSNSKVVDEIIYRAADDIKVLPTCDSLPEPVHLVRNKSTLSLNTEKENTDAGHITEAINKADYNDVLQNEDKVPTLKEVVDKVVELHAMGELVDNPQKNENIDETPPKTEENLYKHNLEETNALEKSEKDPTPAQDMEKEEHTEDNLSPSHSESSRATRWEALADIAAELPPSLTVDPITGQIYAVSK